MSTKILFVPYARPAVHADHVPVPSFVTCTARGSIVSVHDTLEDAEAYIAANPKSYKTIKPAIRPFIDVNDAVDTLDARDLRQDIQAAIDDVESAETAESVKDFGLCLGAVEDALVKALARVQALRVRAEVSRG